MKKTKLIVGCSYIELFKAYNFVSDDAYVIGYPGIDNETISRIVTHTLLENKDIRSVFILWTGLNRKSVNVPPVIQDYVNDKHCYEIGNILSVQSGGEYGTWTANDRLQNFKIQYYVPDDKLHTEHSIYHIMLCQTFLEHRQIPYRYSFIYDYTNPKSSKEQHSLGQVDTNSVYYTEYLSRKDYITTTPYEFGKENGLLHKDKFHLTNEGMNEWIKKIDGERYGFKINDDA